MKKPYCLKKPTGRKYWYYKLPGMDHYLSTRLKVHAKAEEFVIQLLNGDIPNSKATVLKSYTRTMFVFGECKMMKRLEKKGKKVTKYIAAMRLGHLKNYIIPKFGNRIPDTIDSVEIDDWLISLNLSNQTKNHMLTTLNIVFEEILLQGGVRSNPVKYITRFLNEHKSRDILTTKEIILLFPNDLEKEIEIWGNIMWATMFHMLLITGLRLGEIRALQWKDWNREFNIFLINKAVENDDITIKTTKTGEPRTVLIIDRIRNMLLRWEKLSIYSEPDDLIFYCNRDRPINRKTCSDHFKKGLSIANIEIKDRNIVLYSLRHCMNTYLRKSIDDDTLRLFTGHLSPSMTDYYDHPDDEDRMRKILPFKADIEKAWEDTFKIEEA